jgi:uncharacterized protein YjbI with pentapeptide repeats
MNDNQQPDTRAPSDERKAELEAAYERQKDTDAPYKGVEIRSLGELQWIINNHKWLTNANDIKAAEKEKNGSVRGQKVNLSGAIMDGLNFRGACSLDLADLTGASLVGANLAGVSLSGARLEGTDLARANLSSARLAYAWMNSMTNLNRVTLDNKVRLLGVRWNGAPLDRVNWSASTLGDEPTAEILKKEARKEREVLFRNAAHAYHGLVVALREQGLAEPASQYHLREMVMQRKALWQQRNYGGWFLSVLLGAVAGHGEKPNRAFIAYLGIVSLFAALFWCLTNFVHTPGQPSLNIGEAIVLSLSSFHGRGFFTNTIQLGDPLAYAAAFEAVSGLFIELIFIATFSRRFLGD